jgi:hypothetical protein
MNGMKKKEAAGSTSLFDQPVGNWKFMQRGRSQQNTGNTF